jgi:glycosyltransferase involved in cell wall biosynthesis
MPCRTTLVHGVMPQVDNRPVLRQHWPALAFRYLRRRVSGKSWPWEFTAGYLKAFRNARPDVVLAEWGPVAMRCMEACAIARVPLVAHFHGYDTSVRKVLTEYGGYRDLFPRAAALVAVSHAMERKLIELGAPPEKVHYNPYGVDTAAFVPGRPDLAPPVFVAVGRFVEKKAPHLTVLSFAEVHRLMPEARLRMIGDGPLLESCKNLARALRLGDAVEFLGSMNTGQILQELPKARCFVQHSIEAQDGDSEGTPNVVLEAGACGLPVVSTTHAGIPDVVLDGETGFLVPEFDIRTMADRMACFARSPDRARAMGVAARARIEQLFTVERSIEGLHRILVAAASSSRVHA